MTNIKNNEITDLEHKIEESKINIRLLKDRLSKEGKRLDDYKKKLNFLKNGGGESLPVGTRIYFMDGHQKELELILVCDFRSLYSAVLMTDYTEYSKDMSEFYLFKMDCVYSDDLIKELENEYNWKFIKAKGSKE